MREVKFIAGVKMETAAAFIVGTLFTALALWVGIKFAGVRGSFIVLVLIAGISSLCGLIPEVGWIVSILVLFVLVCKWTTADFFPDAVLVVVAAKILGAIGLLLLSQSVV